ncbi:M6 family metalloprotease domain-containing protein [Undibacterium sp. Di27W]|uniref:M6 family metalloprotease domain-containing protein n=1 Tax=Undibacterium sp. Di27W TaxID=3413036 RepID=UPI003BF196AF
MPAQFSGKQFTFTQPDGTKLWVRGWGNQHHAVFETLNGYTVVENPATGFYEYADINHEADKLLASGARPRQVDPRTLNLRSGLRTKAAAAKAQALQQSAFPHGGSRWEIRRKNAKDIVAQLARNDGREGIMAAPPSRATVGNFVGLCILIQFSDIPGTIPQTEVENFCNQAGYRGFGNNGSVHDYFHDVSGGRLNYTNIVTPYYTAKHPRKYYTDESIALPKRTLELIKEALDYFKNKGFDFSKLTIDQQGYIYATNVFYAGTRVNNWKKGLWPHSSHLTNPYQLTPNKQVFDYQITDMTDELSLGTFCHENGHMICDFPDLYDYGNQSAGIGKFCLMCAGPNADEKNPPQINAYLKYKAGWAQTLTALTAGLNASAYAEKNQFFIHKKNATEYFIIENRQRSGRDAALPAAGLAVWHIDELGDNQNEQMTSEKHYECALIQADGRNDLEHDANNDGDATDLFSSDVNKRFGVDTNPKSLWWDGSASRLDLSNISASGLEMRFTAAI